MKADTLLMMDDMTIGVNEEVIHTNIRTAVRRPIDPAKR
jgi:hypothetical protein